MKTLREIGEKKFFHGLLPVNKTSPCFTCLQYHSFVNNVGKGETISAFLTMFSTLLKKSSENVVSLEESKTLERVKIQDCLAKGKLQLLYGPVKEFAFVKGEYIENTFEVLPLLRNI